MTATSSRIAPCGVAEHRGAIGAFEPFADPRCVHPCAPPTTPSRFRRAASPGYAPGRRRLWRAIARAKSARSSFSDVVSQPGGIGARRRFSSCDSNASQPARSSGATADRTSCRRRRSGVSLGCARRSWPLRRSVVSGRTCHTCHSRPRSSRKVRSPTRSPQARDNCAAAVFCRLCSRILIVGLRSAGQRDWSSAGPGCPTTPRRRRHVTRHTVGV
jgi:hypothetical protein